MHKKATGKLPGRYAQLPWPRPRSSSASSAPPWPLGTFQRQSAESAQQRIVRTGQPSLSTGTALCSMMGLSG